MDHPYTKSARIYDVFYNAMLDYPDLAETAHAIIEARLPGAGTLLEVACGTGLYLEQMARWYEVEGLDASQDMLDVAADKLPDVRLHLEDMAVFDLGRAFDVVLCMFSSVGYVVTQERLEAAFHCFATHLHPGGVLILEPWLGPEVWRDEHVSAETVTNDDIAVSRSIASVRAGRRVTMRWAFAVAYPDGEVDTFVEEHPTGLFTPAEYGAALRAAGFEYDYDPDGLLGRGRFVAVKASGR